jgi:hypothetical protein
VDLLVNKNDHFDLAIRESKVFEKLKNQKGLTSQKGGRKM